MVTGYSTYLAPFICKPWQFPEQSPQHQKRWGELPANARVPQRGESAPIRRGGAAFQIAACAPAQITLALMSSEESTRHIGPLDFKTGLNWNHIQESSVEG